MSVTYLFFGFFMIFDFALCDQSFSIILVVTFYIVGIRMYLLTSHGSEKFSQLVRHVLDSSVAHIWTIYQTGGSKSDMAIKISGNGVPSILQKNFNKASSGINDNLKALSSGNRLIRPSVDSASMAIAESLASEIKSSGAASRNISDGISAINIAEGALTSAGDITSRLGELATQASNSTLSSSQRSALDNEFQSLSAELNRISAQTQFNGVSLFGSNTVVQSGTDGSQNSQTSVTIQQVNTDALGLTGLSLSTKEGAQAAVDATKVANDTISSSKSELGASESRLRTSFENLQTQRLSNQEARSRIADVDYASETAKLTANSIRQQGGASLMALANQQSQNVLQLLK